MIPLSASRVFHRRIRRRGTTWSGGSSRAIFARTHIHGRAPAHISRTLSSLGSTFMQPASRSLRRGMAHASLFSARGPVRRLGLRGGLGPPARTRSLEPTVRAVPSTRPTVDGGRPAVRAQSAPCALSDRRLRQRHAEGDLGGRFGFDVGHPFNVCIVWACGSMLPTRMNIQSGRGKGSTLCLARVSSNLGLGCRLPPRVPL